MDNNQKAKSKKVIKHTNVLESLKDVGGSATKSLKRDLLQNSSREFVNQLFGARPAKKYSEEIVPGDSLEFDKILSGKHEETKKLNKQLAYEKRLRQEEQILVETKSNELRVQLQAVMQEVVTLAQTTQNLGAELKTASEQAPVDPGVYHVVFFEKLLEFLKSFRKKVEEAGVWMHATNKRASKKSYWSRYKKHGGKFLLAADHYLTRSAG